MRSKENYENEPILACQGEENRAGSGCNKAGTQYVTVSAPRTLTPGAAVGAAVITCQGAPTVTCETAADGESCSVVVTQRISVSVPSRYNVTVGRGDPTIACAEC